jgi:hypothetical protein
LTSGSPAHLPPASRAVDRIARRVGSFEHLWEVRLDSLGDYLQTNETEEDQS